MKKTLSISIGLILLSAAVLHAQTPLYTDALMMPKKDLGLGLFYGSNSWKKYWEGSLKRSNDNVGTVTTQTVTFMGAYGLSDKVTLITTLPYVWTKGSSGTFTGFKGIQDLTLAVKYNFLTGEFGKSAIKFFLVGSASTPMTNYAVDLQPFSIGMGSTNLSGRFTANYTLNKVWFATVSSSYTWRSNVKLDRPAYYTDGQLHMTNEVQMPDVVDFIARIGYHKSSWRGELYSVNQNTLGGGDIRRQDMPFVSNRMNFSKVGASIMYAHPKYENIAVRAWGDYTIAGRNVGQSTTIMLGAMYFLHFSKQQ
jgi:hypothetical protein